MFYTGTAASGYACSKQGTIRFKSNRVVASLSAVNSAQFRTTFSTGIWYNFHEIGGDSYFYEIEKTLSFHLLNTDSKVYAHC